MTKASEKEIKDALLVARDYAARSGSDLQLGYLALSLQKRVEMLEHILRETEHYLESGQEAAGHAHLLRDIQRYYEELKPQQGTDHQSFGLE
ncbi:MAG: hypothetical protein OQK12_09520 [Motiliproteus sp.]|nr:hypothetical protein [Motiliproteus sp.]MCW9051591.1 hypothetical protein [Motiliproteus sp.]